MGCAGSKTEDLPLVALCRERRELIRDAAEHRYALAAAHDSYFRALERVGDALGRFATEELVAAPDSPVLTLPPSEGKPLKNKSGRSSPGSNGGNASDYVASSPQSPLSSCVSPFSGSHLDVEFQHPHHPSGSDSEKSFDRRCSGGGDDDGRNSFRNSVRFSDFPNANFYYMKSAPTMPSTVYHDLHGEQWSKSQGQAHLSGYGYWYGYPPFAREGAFCNEPLRPIQKEEGPLSADYEEERPPPPPPPPSQSSPWDFFNPFDSYEQMLDGYTKPRFVLGSVASSPNSSEVREREGIPDLEEETEQESVKGTGKRTILEDKRVVDDDSERFNSSVGSSEAVTAPHGEKRSAAVLEDLEEIKRSRGGVSSIDSCEVEDSDVREEPLRGDGKATTSRTMEAGGRTKDTALSIHRTKDVVEAMKEITEQFKSAACCGEDVSRMLEVGKLKYRPKIRIFKGVNVLKMSEGARIDFEKYVNMQSTNLSSTLEQLYLWEKKLYKEVKGEEKLRVFYDKEYARLKTLDDKGAESNKIDSSRAAINKFINKISMSIKSVDAISRRIQKLRDEELRSQLLELIHGLIRMWRSMLDCHQKQFQAIIEAKSHQCLLKPFAQQSLIAKATLELELELMNWCSCFSNWVRAQKAYVESLNGWLIKWLHAKQEETPDGIAPLSPGQVGAPAIFVFSNDWQHTMERISEDDVLKAMHDFTANLHTLCESQGEEQQQKLKAEYLSKDFGRRLKALQKESSGNGLPNAIASDKLVLPANGISTVSNGNEMHLDLMRRRLDAARAKHDDFAKQIQEVVSSSLRTGLIPIFEALENYSSETLKGYDELRLPCT